MFGMMVAWGLAGSPAVAAESVPMAWDWEAGEQHRYLISNQVDLSRLFWLRSETNEERRIMGWKSDFNLLCTGTGPITKRTFGVTCVIEDLQMDVLPNGPTEKDALSIANEWDMRLTGASIELVMRPTGELVDYNLINVKREFQNERSREMVQGMRMFVERALTGLEVSLPKKGDYNGKEWTAKELRVLSVPTTVGTVGGAQFVSTVAKQSGDSITMDTGGKGVRGPAELMPNSAEKYANQWSFVMNQIYTFNTRVGIVTDVQLLARGELTPSSLLATSASPFPYVQAVRTQRKSPKTEMAPFGENGLLVRE